MSWNPTPEQAEVVSCWNEGMAVLAGAGSGKTTTLVQKCLRLMTLRPEAHFAAVSFTDRSAGDLRAKLSTQLTELGVSAPLSRHWVMTIHGLCGSVLREFPREAGFDGEERVLPEGESRALWDKAMETLWFDESASEHQEEDADLQLLLDREGRTGLGELLQRVKELESFGVLESLRASSDSQTRALGRVAACVLEKYRALKQRRGVMDFSDLEQGADRALAHERVQKAYHKRFDLILVDEFQDTNPVQARIIWKLARPDLSNLCVVGDPKQSIYRFRDADVSVFQEYSEKLPRKFILSWNFRSRPGIIQFANQVCEQVFEGSEIPFEPLIATREPTEFAQVVRLDGGPRELASWVRAEVARGIAIESIALLLRKIRGNEKWLRGLAKAGIPIAVGSGGLFWEDPRVRELLAFLRWWDQEQNAYSGGVFLRAPWMQIPDATLDLWFTDEKRSAADHFLSSSHPVACALRPFKGVAVRPGELLLTLHDALGSFGEELGSVVLGLWHRLEDLSTTGVDFSGAVRELSAAVKDSRREREVPAPRNLGQLSVLTLHGAKGLEFPHVLLIDLGEKQRSADSPLLYWDRKAGAYLAGRDDLGQREKKNPAEEVWKERERQKNLAESKRLFYVALTRAQERLILVCPEVLEAPISVQKQQILSSDFWRGWIESSGVELARAVLNTTHASVDSGPKEQVRPKQNLPAAQTAWRIPSTRARHSVTEWNLLARCPRAYEWRYIRPVQGVLDAPHSPVHGSIGTRVHQCLERRDFDSLVTLEQEVGSELFRAQPLIDWAKSAEVMKPETLDTDSLSEVRRVYSELNFEVPLGSEILVGTMDRVVTFGDAEGNIHRVTLVDFKVTSGRLSRSKVLEAYQTQMELYGWALHKLEPDVKLSQIMAQLVVISPSGVKGVSVPWGSNSFDRAQRLAEQAKTIIEGQPGPPKPGKLCKYCEFNSVCPDAVVELHETRPEISSRFV